MLVFDQSSSLSVKTRCMCVLELKEEVLYYDVCEDAEELQSIVYPGQQADSPAVRQLKRRLQNLEMKRGNICARRAYLRNKKVRGRAPSLAHVKLQSYSFRYFMFLCMLGSVYGGPGAEAAAGQAERCTLQPAPSDSSGMCHCSEKPTKANEMDLNKPARLTIFYCLPLQKREKRKDEEQRRKEWVDQEREKTLSRLRSFREVRLSNCLNACQSSPRDSSFIHYFTS